MFQFNPFTAAAVEQSIAAVSLSPPLKPRFLSVDGRFRNDRLPGGFVYDLTQSRIGVGLDAFLAARQAFRHWLPFDLGWTRVRNLNANLELHQAVAVEVRSLGLWSLNISRIVDVVDAPARFGFVYQTTTHHVEEGEERFLVEFIAQTGAVHYTLEAVSQPRALLARAGYPVTRHFQRRFARDSHIRLRNAAVALSKPPLA